MIQAKPRINPVSQMIEPTALPRARPGLPSIAAKTETAASGEVVPRLTIVAPTTAFGILERSDKATASSTSQSAAFPSTARLTVITSASSVQCRSDTRWWIASSMEILSTGHPGGFAGYCVPSVARPTRATA